MKKNFLGDIRPLSRPGSEAKRQTADVAEPAPVHTRQRPILENRDSVVEKTYTHEPHHPHTPKTRHPSWGRITAVIVAALVIVAGGLYALSFMFRGATVTVTPKHVSGSVDLSLNASSDENATLHYEVMTLPETVTKEVTATQTDTAKMKASGTVVLYNFQTTSQQLIATTRFADAKGQVFRLPTGVTIPKKTAAGPGQVTVTLVADQGGPEGNIPLSDFTVVAFKGTAKEKLVYGRGKTAFTGGTSGAVFYLTDEEYKTAVTGLETDLKNKLQEETTKQIPDGYVLLPNSMTFIADDSVKNTPSQTATVTVTYGGKQRAILIKETDLKAAFLKAIAPEETVDPSQVTFRGTDALVYNITSDISKETLPKTISFTVKGDLMAVWSVDIQAVKKLLAGAQRMVFSTRMQTIASVDEAELILHPFWMNTLPTDAEKINVVVNEPQRAE